MNWLPPPLISSHRLVAVSFVWCFLGNEPIFASEISGPIPTPVRVGGYLLATFLFSIVFCLAMYDHAQWKKYMRRLNQELDAQVVRMKEAHKKWMSDGKEPWEP